jgi:hypothetical protein
LRTSITTFKRKFRQTKEVSQRGVRTDLNCSKKKVQSLCKKLFSDFFFFGSVALSGYGLLCSPVLDLEEKLVLDLQIIFAMLFNVMAA